MKIFISKTGRKTIFSQKFVMQLLIVFSLFLLNLIIIWNTIFIPANQTEGTKVAWAWMGRTSFIVHSQNERRQNKIK